MSGERARVTLADVAAAAGVSPATASRVLNGSTRQVREDLRERVAETAHRLRYSVDAQAQAMARGRSTVVGLIVHDISDPYFSAIAAGVMGAADEHGLIVTLGSTRQRHEREIDHLAMLRRQRSRAAIIAGSRTRDRAHAEALRHEVEEFVASGGRVVAIGQQGLGADTVVVENRAGARTLATALIERGYRRFALLAGPEQLVTARDRVRGFREGLAAATGSGPRQVPGAFTRDGGYAAMAELMAGGELPECVFAVNDVMAVGAIAACHDHGIAVPGDVALAGFDDIPTLRDVRPGLSTVRLPLLQMGAMALEMVTSAQDAVPPRVRRVRGEVVLRASTPPR